MDISNSCATLNNGNIDSNTGNICAATYNYYIYNNGVEDYDNDYDKRSIKDISIEGIMIGMMVPWSVWLWKFHNKPWIMIMILLIMIDKAAMILKIITIRAMELSVIAVRYD